MKKIFCFVENNDKALNDFLMKYDADFEIHVYFPVIESCEDSLFYCIGNMISLYFEGAESRCWIVTDVEEIYQLTSELCDSLFEKIIYFNHDVTMAFSNRLDANELLLFDYKMISDIKMRVTLQKFISNISFFDVAFFSKFELEMRGFVEQLDKKMLAFLAHICRLLFYMEKKGDVVIAELYRLFLLSMLMKLEYLPEHTNAYLDAIVKQPAFGEDSYYFVWNQFKGVSLKKLAALDAVSFKTLNYLYRESYKRYKKRAKKILKKIPSQERHQNRVLIMTIQFLGINHAPTKTVLERCRAYKKMGKDVYLVNTAEQGTMDGYVPFFMYEVGNVIKEYQPIETLEIGRGKKIWFRQLDESLPLWKRFLLLVEYIKEIKPGYILSIGTGSMLADLCSSIVPCASMALAFSTLPMTMNCIKILGRNVRKDELEDSRMKDVIESRFTFELKPQKMHFTRQQYQIPEDRFVLVVIGIRLDYEITSELCDVLERVCRKGCFVVFAGIYDSYHKVKESNLLLAQNSTFIGYCDDILALMEICDLYVNPKRLGGGFSLIEAFTKGVPGVYLQTGDVYTAGGEAFSVNDFDEMEQLILRYKEDSSFYRTMSDKARERAGIMTSSLRAMKDLDEKIKKKIEKEFW